MEKDTRTFADGDGNQLKVGDWFSFSFGVPPRRVEAQVIERDGVLIALTPDVNPKEGTLRDIDRHAGPLWKIPGPTKTETILKKVV